MVRKAGRIQTFAETVRETNRKQAKLWLKSRKFSIDEIRMLGYNEDKNGGKCRKMGFRKDCRLGAG
jgi:hypothetical protein